MESVCDMCCIFYILWLEATVCKYWDFIMGISDLIINVSTGWLV